MQKPDREIYEEVARSVGCLPAEIFFVDDNMENVQAAIDVGMHGYSLLRCREVLEGVIVFLPVDLVFVQPRKTITLRKYESENMQAVRIACVSLCFVEHPA